MPPPPPSTPGVRAEPKTLEIGGLAGYHPLVIRSDAIPTAVAVHHRGDEARPVDRLKPTTVGTIRFLGERHVSPQELADTRPFMEIPWTTDHVRDFHPMGSESVLEMPSEHLEVVVPHGWSVSVYGSHAPIYITGDITNVRARLVGDITINTSPTRPDGRIDVEDALRLRSVRYDLVENPQSIRGKNIREVRVERHCPGDQLITLSDVQLVDVGASNAQIHLFGDKLACINSRTTGNSRVHVRGNSTQVSGVIAHEPSPEGLELCVADISVGSVHKIVCKDTKLGLSARDNGVEVHANRAPKSTGAADDPTWVSVSHYDSQYVVGVSENGFAGMRGWSGAASPAQLSQTEVEQGLWEYELDTTYEELSAICSDVSPSTNRFDTSTSSPGARCLTSIIGNGAHMTTRTTPAATRAEDAGGLDRGLES